MKSFIYSYSDNSHFWFDEDCAMQQSSVGSCDVCTFSAHLSGRCQSQQSLALKHPPQIPTIILSGVTTDSAVLMISKMLMSKMRLCVRVHAPIP